MRAAATPSPRSPGHPLHALFLGLLPRIERHATVYFRYIDCPARRADAVAEAVALAWMWFVRLARRGKDASQFPMALAGYVARAVSNGRRLCGMERSKDVLSAAAQKRRGFRVEPLPTSSRTDHERLHGAPHGQARQDTFEERLRDNTVTPVIDQVAFRIDFPAWPATLGARERRLVRAMARNERTLDLSRQFDLTPGRISQLRRQFHHSWRLFQGEPPAPAPRAGGGVP